MVYFNLVDMGRVNSPRLREPTVTNGMEHGNGHRDGDTTTHYSAPKLAELMAATENVRQTPALVILTRRTSVQRMVTY